MHHPNPKDGPEFLPDTFLNTKICTNLLVKLSIWTLSISEFHPVLQKPFVKSQRRHHPNESAVTICLFLKPPERQYKPPFE